MTKYDPMSDEYYLEDKTSNKDCSGDMSSLTSEMALFESMCPTSFEIGAMAYQIRSMRMFLKEKRKKGTLLSD